MLNQKCCFSPGALELSPSFLPTLACAEETTGQGHHQRFVILGRKSGRGASHDLGLWGSLFPPWPPRGQSMSGLVKVVSLDKQAEEEEFQEWED